MSILRRFGWAGAPLIILVAGACSEQIAEPTAAEQSPAAESTDETAPAALPRIASPAGARVFFITPADGATVASPVTIEFGIEGMSIVKAGDDTANSGHHHLLVDTGLPELGLPVPADEKHIHFGDGSSATELTLEPGQHTLQLLLGDHAHIPHDPPVSSDTITITVE